MQTDIDVEPFAYGIQASIGSVTPLFHKLKDAEDFIAKLTDSRAEAKIIPLYRAATLTDAEREFLQNLHGAYEEMANQTGYVNAAAQKEAREHAVLLKGLLEKHK